MRSRWTRLAQATAACGLWGLAAYSAASPELIKLRTQVFQESVVTDAQGRASVQRVPAAQLGPGSEVVYEVGYSNTGSKPMQVIITNPLPEDLIYQSYAARSVGAQLEVSVDQGRSFGLLEKLTVPSVDGTTRPASERDITHVRWKTQRPVNPGEAGYVSLKAKVR